jgi:hypothetical protein
MTTGQKKDKLLNEIDLTARPFSHLYKKWINKEEEDEKIYFLMEEMISEGLIKIGEFQSPNGEFVTLDIKGQKIKEAGGFLKVEYETMSEGEKIHRLLKYIVESNSSNWEWTSESLMPAFEDALNKYEIEYLCGVLITNGDVADNRNKDYFAIGFTDISKSAYFGKKYLNRPTHSQSVKVDIGQFQSIVGSTINAPVTQAADSNLSNTKSKVTLNPPSPNETMQAKTWTLSNITFTLIIGIIVTVVGGLVLIYWERIKQFFE